MAVLPRVLLVADDPLDDTPLAGVLARSEAMTVEISRRAASVV